MVVYVAKYKHEIYVIDENISYGNGGFEKDGLVKFYTDYCSGGAVPWVKSERKVLSEENGVRIATGKNFHEVVLGSEKDLLIYVYSSKNYLNVIEEVARDGAIDVVKINKKLNFIPVGYLKDDAEYLLLRKADQKQGLIQYALGWNYHEIKNFIHQAKIKTDL